MNKDEQTARSTASDADSQTVAGRRRSYFAATVSPSTAREKMSRSDNNRDHVTTHMVATRPARPGIDYSTHGAVSASPPKPAPRPPKPK